MFECVPGDVEWVKTQYLAQWGHVGCGGAPRAESGMLTCNTCGERWVWLGTLEYTLERIKEFRRLTLR